MEVKSFKEIQNNEAVRKRLAKFMVRDCFRNSDLENLHSGKFPSSPAGDYSDVKVVSPLGEIPWKELARFDNNEMKKLMIDVVNLSYSFLTELFQNPESDKIIEKLKKEDPIPKWNDPV